MRSRVSLFHGLAFIVLVCLHGSSYAQAPAAVSGTGHGTGLVYGVEGVIDQTNTTPNAAGVHGVGGEGNNYGVLGEAGPSSLSAGVCGIGGVRGFLGTPPPYEFLVGAVAGLSQYNPGILGQSGYSGVTGRFYDNTNAFRAEGDLGFETTSGAFTFIYAVYAQGNTGATGIKSFVEPHPTDPSKAIRFVSLEGNEAGTYFRGRGHFVDGKAVIHVPDEFRMVTEEEGLTVNVTPMGRIASVGVITADLNEITVESTNDVDFSYVVYGVRRGYKDFQSVAQTGEFIPRSPDERIPAYLNAAQKERLIANGTYNPDGTVNIHTAIRLGWDRLWAERRALATK